MKKIIFTSLLVVLLFIGVKNCSFAHGCDLNSCINNQIFNGALPSDTSISLTDSLTIAFSICCGNPDGTCNGSPVDTCQIDTIWAFLNGAPILTSLIGTCFGYGALGILVHDTGIYQIYFYRSCGFPLITYTMHLHYLPTLVNEISNQNAFQLFPSLSSGLFQLKTNEHLKKILITDGVGRIVYSSSLPVSEINLSNVADGIYFYAIEDDKEYVFRGKVVKD